MDTLDTSTSTIALCAHVAIPETGGDGLFVVPVVDGACELRACVRLNASGRRAFEALARGEEPEGAPGFSEDLKAHGLLMDGEAGAAGRGKSLGPMSHGKNPIPAGELVRLARAVLGAGFRLRLRVLGRSMRPWIESGTWIEVAAIEGQELRIGDVLFYEEAQHPFVAHRFCGRSRDGLIARGDSSVRRDVVGPGQLYGKVVRVRESGGSWEDVGGVCWRLAGRASGMLWRGALRVAWLLVLGPLRRSFARPSRVRGGLRFGLRGMSGVLLRLERLARRVRRPLDVARAGLLASDEKDADRSALYARRSTQNFTSLDENVAAGLTLIEEVMLARHPLEPGRALVLGCGPGRECFSLAERGWTVTGLDREDGMLARGREYAQQLGHAATFVHGEATEFRMEERFEAVVLFSGLFDMVLPRSRRVAMLACAREHLVPGGHVLLTFLSAYREPGAPPLSGAKSLWEAVNPDHDRGDLYLLNEAIHLFPDGEGVRAEAREAGLEVVAVERDQRAYDRGLGQVKGYAILRRA